MCLDPLLPRQSGVSLPWGVTHPRVRPILYTFLWLGFLVLLIQLELMSERSCCGVVFYRPNKIIFSVYYCEVFLLICTGVNIGVVIFEVGEGFCCVKYWRGFIFFFFVVLLYWCGCWSLFM